MYTVHRHFATIYSWKLYSWCNYLKTTLLFPLAPTRSCFLLAVFIELAYLWRSFLRHTDQHHSHQEHNTISFMVNRQPTCSSLSCFCSPGLLPSRKRNVQMSHRTHTKCTGQYFCTTEGGEGTTNTMSSTWACMLMSLLVPGSSNHISFDWLVPLGGPQSYRDRHHRDRPFHSTGTWPHQKSS